MVLERDRQRCRGFGQRPIPLTQLLSRQVHGADPLDSRLDQSPVATCFTEHPALECRVVRDPCREARQVRLDQRPFRWKPRCAVECLFGVPMEAVKCDAGRLRGKEKLHLPYGLAVCDCDRTEFAYGSRTPIRELEVEGDEGLRQVAPRHLLFAPKELT